MDEVEAVLAGQFDEPRKKRQVNGLGCRVRGEVDDQRLGPRGHARNEVFKLGEKLVAVGDGHADHVRSGDDRAIDVDGVAGIGHQHGVAQSRMARQRWAMPSFDPMVTMASVSGSRSTS